MPFQFPVSLQRAPFFTLRAFGTQPLGMVLLFGAPLLNLFRVDLLAQELIVLGQAYPLETETLQWLPWTFYAGVLVVALISAVLGRLFCGWLCPHNTMSELTRAIRRWLGFEAQTRKESSLLARHPWLKTPSIIIGVLAGLLVALLASVLIFHYFIPLSALFAPSALQPLYWMGLGLLSVIGFFLLFSGHHFCRYACPYGMAQGMCAYLDGKFKPMEIRLRDPQLREDCGGCKGCQTACPVDLDPRLFSDENEPAIGLFKGCFNCGLCIDACNVIHETHPSITTGTTGFLRFKMPFSKSA